MKPVARRRRKPPKAAGSQPRTKPPMNLNPTGATGIAKTPAPRILKHLACCLLLTRLAGPLWLEAAPAVATPAVVPAASLKAVTVRSQADLTRALNGVKAGTVSEIQFGAGQFEVVLAAKDHNHSSRSAVNRLRLTMAPGANPADLKFTKVQLTNVNYVSVEGLPLKDVGLEVVGGRDVRLVRNVLTGGAGSVVVQNASGVRVEENLVGTTQKGPDTNGIRLTSCRNSSVTGNVVRNAVSSGSGECITVKACENIEVAFNEVCDRANVAVNKGGEGIGVSGSRFIAVHDNVVHDLQVLPVKVLPPIVKGGKSDPAIGRAGIYIDSYEGINQEISVYNNVVFGCAVGIVVSNELMNLVDSITVHSNLVVGVEKTQFALAEFNKEKNGRAPARNVQFLNNTAVRTRKDTPSWTPVVSVDVCVRSGEPDFTTKEGIRVHNNRGYDLPRKSGGQWSRCVLLTDPRLTFERLSQDKVYPKGAQAEDVVSDAEKNVAQRSLNESAWVKARNMAAENEMVATDNVRRVDVGRLEVLVSRPNPDRSQTPYQRARQYLAGVGVPVAEPHAPAGGLPTSPTRIARRPVLTSQNPATTFSHDPEKPTEIQFRVTPELMDALTSGVRIWQAALKLPKLSEGAVNPDESWYYVRGRKADGSLTKSLFGWLPRKNWTDQSCSDLGPVLTELLLSGEVFPEQVTLSFTPAVAPLLGKMQPVKPLAGDWQLSVELVESSVSYSAWPGTPAPVAPKRQLRLEWVDQVAVEYGAADATAQPCSKAPPVAGVWTYQRIARDGQDYLVCTFTPSDASYAAASGEIRLTTTPKPVKMKAVSREMTYGDALPQFVCEDDGAIESDRTALRAAFRAEIRAAADGKGVAINGPLPAGQFQVMVQPLDPATLGEAQRAVLGRYKVTPVDGVLTVRPAVAEWYVDTAARFVGEENPGFTGRWFGLRNGDSAVLPGWEVAMQTDAGPASAEGSYQIKATGVASLGNYVFRYHPGQMKVFPIVAEGSYVGLIERGALNAHMGHRVILQVTATGAYSLQLRSAASLFNSKAGRLFASPSGASVLRADLRQASIGAPSPAFAGFLDLQLDSAGKLEGRLVSPDGTETLAVSGCRCTTAAGEAQFQVGLADGSGAAATWTLQKNGADATGRQSMLKGFLAGGLGFLHYVYGAGAAGELLVYTPMNGSNGAAGSMMGVLKRDPVTGRVAGHADLLIPAQKGQPEDRRILGVR
jgi:hypothetical protein